RLTAWVGSPRARPEQLMMRLRENTRLGAAAPDAAEPALAVVPGEAALGARLDTSLPDTARKAMERHFAPLHRLLDEEGGAGPELSATLRALDDVHSLLNGLAHANQPEQTAYELARQRMSGRSDALSQLRVSAARLPKPVSQWLGILADDSWMLLLSEAQQHLNQR